jgi:acetylornithine deacetylase/succinyl-diaminopimelate desuccinylase-like protein
VITSRAAAFTPADLDLLLEFLEIPSVSPLEGGDLTAVAEAQRLFAKATSERGFDILLHAAPPQEVLDWPGLPVPVRTAASDDRRFLQAQPSVVAARGYVTDENCRLVFNFHVDTVAPHIATTLWHGLLRGRGCLDDKGPGIAVLAGVTAAFAREPWLADVIQVQIASVPGEEGGAMGTYGTRWLIRRGITGRLMVFAEPSGGSVLDTCTATMTLEISVAGDDVTDDFPEQGHNATVALGFLAAYLAEQLDRVVSGLPATACIGGLHTGHAHNRVYGSGRLLVNIAYADNEAGRLIREVTEDLCDRAADEFRARFTHNRLTARLYADWERVVRPRWLKAGLPVLVNRDVRMESVLARVGFQRRDAIGDSCAFASDAIWAGGPGRYVAVCGPGRLDEGGAHSPDEHISLSELEAYAARVADLVTAFGVDRRALEGS